MQRRVGWGRAGAHQLVGCVCIRPVFLVDVTGDDLDPVVVPYYAIDSDASQNPLAQFVRHSPREHVVAALDGGELLNVFFQDLLNALRHGTVLSQPTAIGSDQQADKGRGRIRLAEPIDYGQVVEFLRSSADGPSAPTFFQSGNAAARRWAAKWSGSALSGSFNSSGQDLPGAGWRNALPPT